MRTVASFASLALGLGATGFGLWRNMDLDDNPVPNDPAAVFASEAPEASPVVSEPSETAPPTPPEPTTVSCSNLKIGYTLEYPAELITTANNPDQECRFFDEQPVTVAQPPPNTEAAIVITPLNVDYQSWIDSFEQEGITIIQRFELVVGGLPATVTEFSFVNDPSGAINYTFDVDHDGVLVMFANSVYSDDFELTKRTLNAMAASLVFQ